jgi:hypothetical protein
VFAHVSWLGVAIGAAAAFALGFVWYGPLFGKAWRHAIGLSPDQRGNRMAALSTNLITSLVTSTVLAALVTQLASEVVTAAVVGILVWLAGVVPLKLNDVTFGARPSSLLYIDATYQLISFVAMAAINSALRV